MKPGGLMPHGLSKKSLSWAETNHPSYLYRFLFSHLGLGLPKCLFLVGLLVKKKKEKRSIENSKLDYKYKQFNWSRYCNFACESISLLEFACTIKRHRWKVCINIVFILVFSPSSPLTAIINFRRSFTFLKVPSARF